jgi:hypothetical protein
LVHAQSTPPLGHFHPLGLVSPASGDQWCILQCLKIPGSFPFNWCPQRVGTPYFHKWEGSPLSFHSIGVPSEWGPLDDSWLSEDDFCVSIQLVSPASGDYGAFWGSGCCTTVGFHSIGVPSEWGQELAFVPEAEKVKFPFNWCPQRVGTTTSVLVKGSA